MLAFGLWFGYGVAKLPCDVVYYFVAPDPKMEFYDWANIEAFAAFEFDLIEAFDVIPGNCYGYATLFPKIEAGLTPESAPVTLG